MGPQDPSWAALDNRKETRLWPIEWGSICCSSVRSPTPFHTQTIQIKWEVYFSKRTVSLVLIVSLCSACRCICNLCLVMVMAIQKKYQMYWIWTRKKICRKNDVDVNMNEKWTWFPNVLVALSIGTVEYTDWSLQRGKTPPTSALDMKLNSLVVRFKQCWSFGECRIFFHCYRS